MDWDQGREPIGSCITRTNASILEEIGVSKQLLHTSNIRMLSHFGHIARRKGNNLEKVIMQGMIEGKRRKGQPQSRWIDQIRSAIGLPLCDCYALAEDCHLWRCMYACHELSAMTGKKQSTNQPPVLVCVGATDIKGRFQISNTTPYNGIINHRAPIGVFRPLPITHAETNANRMHPWSPRLRSHAPCSLSVCIFTLTLQLMQVTYAPDECYFDYRINPNTQS